MSRLPVTELVLEKDEQLESLTAELIKSYEKELKLLTQIRQLKAENKTLHTRAVQLHFDRDIARKHLRTLQDSPFGRLQRWYWRMRKKMKR